MRPFVLAVTLLLAGCAQVVDGAPPLQPAEPPPAHQIVFRVQTGGGFVPSEYYASGRPIVTIYGNGDAYLAAGRSGSRATRPVELRRGRVPRAVLLGLVDDAERSGLFRAGRDFGDPRVTDLPSTGVTFRPDAAPARTASAYALDYRDGDDELSPGQRAGRQALRRLVDDLVEAVRSPARWTPDRIDVTEIDGDRTGGAQDWPGPALDTVLRTTPRGRCGELTGAAARRAFEAARTADDPLWRDAGGVRPLVLRALLPREAACR